MTSRCLTGIATDGRVGVAAAAGSLILRAEPPSAAAIVNDRLQLNAIRSAVLEDHANRVFIAPPTGTVVIELRDSVFIQTPPEKVWEWLANLPDHYKEWHPAHGRCWYTRGRGLEAGAVVTVEEELHGRPHRLSLRMREIVPNRLLRYSSWGIRGAFLLEKANGGTHFTAMLNFGVAVPLLGRVADRVLGRIFATRLAAVQEHMQEEGRQLKRLLEQRAA